MRKIQKKLKENYLNIEEQYNISFDIFKKFIKKNIWTVLIFIGLMILSRLLAVEADNFWKLDFNGIANGLYTEEEIVKILRNFHMRKLLLKFPVIPIALVTSVISAVFIKKTYNTVYENKETGFSNLLVKKIIYGFMLLIFVALGGTISLIVTLLLIIVFNLKGIVILLIFFSLLGGCLFLIFYYSMYLEFIYYIRDIELYEAFLYNMEISRGNRKRLIYPLALLYLLRYLALIPVFILSWLSLHPFMHYFSFFLFVTAIVFTGTVKIFGTVLWTAVYLNVENMDLKKSREKAAKNIEKIEEN